MKAVQLWDQRNLNRHPEAKQQLREYMDYTYESMGDLAAARFFNTNTEFGKVKKLLRGGSSEIAQALQMLEDLKVKNGPETIFDLQHTKGVTPAHFIYVLNNYNQTFAHINGSIIQNIFEQLEKNMSIEELFACVDSMNIGVDKWSIDQTKPTYATYLSLKRLFELYLASRLMKIWKMNKESSLDQKQRIFLYEYCKANLHSSNSMPSLDISEKEDFVAYFSTKK